MSKVWVHKDWCGFPEDLQMEEDEDGNSLCPCEPVLWEEDDWREHQLQEYFKTDAGLAQVDKWLEIASNPENLVDVTGLTKEELRAHLWSAGETKH